MLRLNNVCYNVLCWCWFIQIQPMLRLNQTGKPRKWKEHKHSNTTNVKVKRLLRLLKPMFPAHSNTTNVKVKQFRF